MRTVHHRHKGASKAVQTLGPATLHLCAPSSGCLGTEGVLSHHAEMKCGHEIEAFV
jgi:hypothetical protein